MIDDPNDLRHSNNQLTEVRIKMNCPQRKAARYQYRDNFGEKTLHFEGDMEENLPTFQSYSA